MLPGFPIGSGCIGFMSSIARRSRVGVWPFAELPACGAARIASADATRISVWNVLILFLHACVGSKSRSGDPQP